MLSRKNRIYVALGTYFLATMGLFVTGTAWWYLLLVAGILYVLIGGKKHV